MSITKRIFLAALVIGLTAACSSPEPVPDQDPTAEVEGDTVGEAPEESEADEALEDPARAALEAAADGAHRSEEDRARNQYRNPVETMLFFGFEPGQSVVELWPGRGWYTGVLAPASGADVPLRAGIFAMDEDDPEDYRTRITVEYLEWVQTNQDALGPLETGTFAPPEVAELGEPESASLVVSFRNLHNMYNGGVLEDVLEAVHAVLEPGGVFGVVQHRAPQGSDPDETSENGYLSEQFVKETVEAAGFVVDGTSEINANPMDTADHPDGVWSLPPSLRGGEEDAERFLEIGESDRMTIRFVKPAQ